MTVEAIKAAIEHLSEPERQKLADWFEELEEQAWDAEMEKDLSPQGRGHSLVERIKQEIDQGNFPLWKRACARGLSSIELHLSRLTGILGSLQHPATSGPRASQEAI